MFLLAFARITIAAEAPPTSRPALNQLNQEIRALYHQVENGVVRISLPPVWRLLDEQSLLQKWDKRLDPAVREKIEEQMNAAREVHPQGSLNALERVPRQILAILFDDKGHLLVPAYLEKEAVDQKGIPVSSADGRAAMAKFIGSDRKTGLTVLKLEESAGTALALDENLPANGSLVLILSPNGEAPHLSLWTGGQRDYGVVITLDGRVAGLVRHGQFLSGAALKPVIDQLIQHGMVKRATLGVLVSQLPLDDPRRRQIEALGRRPAMVVERILPESAAAKAGLQVGDLILSVADEPVGDPPSFAAAIAGRNGQTSLQVLREGREMTIVVDLQPR